MARPLKEGLDYFSLDINIESDDKIQFIEAEHGIVGFGVIIKILCKIYGSHGYYTMMTSREQKLFSNRINVDINSINAIINSAVNEDFFDKTLFDKYGILTSKRIQERFLTATERRKTIFFERNLLLITLPDDKKYVTIDNFSKNSINVDINSINVDINSINVNISTQSKVKESKVKESKVSKKENINVDINTFFQHFYLNTIGQPITPTFYKLCCSYMDDGMDEIVITQAILLGRGKEIPHLYIEKVLKEWFDKKKFKISDFEKEKKDKQAYDKKPSYAKFEQRQYEEDVFEKYYANLKQE